MDLENGILGVLPKDRISDQKKHWIGDENCCMAVGTKLGYRGGLGTKLLSCLHCTYDAST